MATISAIINTLNEEHNIEACLTGLKWADEIIVVDMKSDDRTVELAKKHGAKVYSHERMGHVEPARNYAISKAQSEWILVVDADERIGSKLAKELRSRVEADEADVYYIAEKNLVFGAWVKGSLLWPDYHARLFRKGMIEWTDRVHYLPTPKGRIENLPAEENFAIEHHSVSYLTIDGFLTRYVGYSAKEMENLEQTGYRFRRRHILILPYREFKLRFFGAKGYQDGFRGLVISLLFAQYKFMTLIRFWEKHEQGIKEKPAKGGRRYLVRMMRDK
jgi:glycosyltransferase involved in cell wall biosynthesis